MYNSSESLHSTGAGYFCTQFLTGKNKGISFIAPFLPRLPIGAEINHQTSRITPGLSTQPSALSRAPRRPTMSAQGSGGGGETAI